MSAPDPRLRHARSCVGAGGRPLRPPAGAAAGLALFTLAALGGGAGADIELADRLAQRCRARRSRPRWCAARAMRARPVRAARGRARDVAGADRPGRDRRRRAGGRRRARRDLRLARRARAGGGIRRRRTLLFVGAALPETVRARNPQATRLRRAAAQLRRRCCAPDVPRLGAAGRLRPMAGCSRSLAGVVVRLHRRARPHAGGSTAWRWRRRLVAYVVRHLRAAGAGCRATAWPARCSARRGFTLAGGRRWRGCGLGRAASVWAVLAAAMAVLLRPRRRTSPAARPARSARSRSGGRGVGAGGLLLALAAFGVGALARR